LAACWHPVAFADEVGAQPVARQLLDEPLVIYRTPGGVVAARDLCLHRGVPLSLGSVSGDELVCAYHGYRYAPDGRCTRVPALPGVPIPPKLCLTTYAAQERHGLIWVCLAPEPKQPLPDWPEMENPAFRRLHLPALEWNASAARTLENFLDVGHFSWIHTGTFGNRDLPEVPKYDVVRQPGGLHMEYPYLAANPDHSPLAAAKVIQRWMIYDVTLPFACRLAINYSADRRYVICEACAPVSARRVRIHFSVALNFDHDRAAEDILGWERRVVAEDRPIVEAQRPEELPLDLAEEFHLRCDRMSTAYRQALGELGLGRPFTA
jgi:phenylpropionate dioxygenase-like ring-hydroxylating dioxygenase large terminal subunit